MSGEILGAEPFDLFTDEALEEFVASQTKRVRSRNVCACGHSMNFHKEIGGRQMCTPAKMHCRCVNPRAVLAVENLRLFLRSTEGYGKKHALGKGILASRNKGAAVEWVSSEPCCDDCGVVTAELAPVSVNTTGSDRVRVVKESGQIDKLLCEECYVKWTMLGA